MKFLLSALIVSFAATAIAAEDAKNAAELGKQVHAIKREARVEKASAYRRFKARKLELRAVSLRKANDAAAKAVAK
jgi:hypothetical protein